MSTIPQKPTALDADDNLLELARIFAEGVLRLHQNGELPMNTNGLCLETALKTARQDLEQSRKKRLTVTRG
jgi:hypothetical protein